MVRKTSRWPETVLLCNPNLFYKRSLNRYCFRPVLSVKISNNMETVNYTGAVQVWGALPFLGGPTEQLGEVKDLGTFLLPSYRYPSILPGSRRRKKMLVAPRRLTPHSKKSFLTENISLNVFADHTLYSSGLHICKNERWRVLNFKLFFFLIHKAFFS